MKQALEEIGREVYGFNEWPDDMAKTFAAEVTDYLVISGKNLDQLTIGELRRLFNLFGSPRFTKPSKKKAGK